MVADFTVDLDTTQQRETVDTGAECAAGEKQAPARHRQGQELWQGPGEDTSGKPVGTACLRASTAS